MKAIGAGGGPSGTATFRITSISWGVYISREGGDSGGGGCGGSSGQTTLGRCLLNRVRRFSLTPKPLVRFGYNTYSLVYV